MLIAVALVTSCGTTTTTPASAPTTSSTTTAGSTARTTASTPASIAPRDIFVQMMRDKGYVQTTNDTNLLLVEADIYCRGLAAGRTRQQIFDQAGLPGSTARTKAENVFFAAVVTMCPEHSAAATK